MDECDKSADCGFRCDMPAHQSVRAAGEAAVGDKSNRITQTRSYNRRGRREHLAHSRPALWPLVSNHQYIALFYLAGEDSIESVFLTIEDARRARDLRVLDPGNLGNASLGREIALENRQAPLRIHGVFPLTDNRLALRRRVRTVSQRRRESLAADRHLRAMHA